MSKVAIITGLALAVGITAATSSNAAVPSAMTDEMRAALAASTDTVQRAQHPPRRAVAPVGARRAVVGRPVGVVGRPVGVVGRPVGVVGPRRVGVGRAAVVGRPVFVRGYRPWVRRPYFGTIVGGIALGTLVTVAVVGAAPAYAPAPGLCWYWADPSLTTGFWDYCS